MRILKYDICYLFIFNKKLKGIREGETKTKREKEKPSFFSPLFDLRRNDECVFPHFFVFYF